MGKFPVTGAGAAFRNGKSTMTMVNARVVNGDSS
jgi:hypothetical protein